MNKIKKLHKKYIIILCSLLIIVGLFIPLHRTSPNFNKEFNTAQIFLLDNPEKSLEIYQNLLTKNNDKYVKAYILAHMLDYHSFSGETCIKAAKELINLDITLNYNYPIQIINTLYYYGHYELAKNFVNNGNYSFYQYHNHKTNIANILFYETLKCTAYLKEGTCVLSWKKADTSKEKAQGILESNAEKPLYYTPIAMKYGPIASNWKPFDYVRYYTTIGDLDAAKKAMDIIFDGTTTYHPHISAYIDLALKYKEKKQYKKAIKCLEAYAKHQKNWQNDNGNYRFYQELLECYEKLGDKQNIAKYKKIMDKMLSW